MIEQKCNSFLWKGEDDRAYEYDYIFLNRRVVKINQGLYDVIDRSHYKFMPK
jgi:hypothetical protein